jgi:hypothetical protein
MPVNDQTFHRTLVSCGRIVYAHPEHGGPTEEPLRADFTSNVDQHLGQTMRFARQTHPQYEWVYARLLVQVVPFDPQSVVEKLIRDRVREQALRKLTPEEREALGL